MERRLAGRPRPSLRAVVRAGSGAASGAFGAESAERAAGRAAVNIVEGASIRAAGEALKREMRVETKRHYQQRRSNPARDRIRTGPDVPVVLAEFE